MVLLFERSVSDSSGQKGFATGSKLIMKVATLYYESIFRKVACGSEGAF